MTWSEMQPASCRFTLKVSLQSFGLGLKAMGLASLGRKCNRHHAGFDRNGLMQAKPPGSEASPGGAKRMAVLIWETA